MEMTGKYMNRKGLVLMNKNDLKLIVVTLIVSVFIFAFVKIFTNNSSDKEALVYYRDEMVLKIDLNDVSYRSFSVVGDNGLVEIETENGKIRVVSENSPLHICSKQGWSDSVYTPIVCLPNSVVIKIVADSKTVDTVVN